MSGLLRALILILLMAGIPGGWAKEPARKPPAEPPDTGTPMKGGRFGTVKVYVPQGPPHSVAIFLSGDGGWNLGVLGMAHALVEEGAVVIGVDIRQYLAAIGKSAQQHPGCQNIAGDFENLSHRVQKELRLTDYHVPVLLGYSSGATVVYAALVQSPPGTFAGAMSLGFCADQNFGGARLCPGTGVGLRFHPGKKKVLIFEPAASLRQPWIAFQGQQDEVCPAAPVDSFVAKIPAAKVVRLPQVGHGFLVESRWMPQFKSAYQELVPHPDLSPQRPPGINDLPLNEVPASGSGAELALLLTGDGGWAGLDQELAARLAARGVPTVALNSLKYFWTARTPQQVTDDAARILRHYLAQWHKERVLLVGYSFGADVLPFVARRLPEELRARVAAVTLMGLEDSASFEIHVTEWLGAGSPGLPTRPELDALDSLPMLCIYGQGEEDSLCPSLPAPRFQRMQVGKGHHFSGQYAQLADQILAFSRTRR